MRKVVFIILFLMSAHLGFAQADLFGTTDSAKARKGVLITANGQFDLPAADMAKRFGNSYRIGGAITYKTKKGWLYGAKIDFILGAVIREDSLMINIKDQYGDFLNQSGQRIGVPIYERGYAIGLEFGKILPLSKKSYLRNPDNGLMLLTSAGFLQHKIDIFDKDKSVPQLRDQYLKGYDRLTNGMYVEQYVAYTYFARDGLLNFHIGLDAMFGFTKDRRDYLYDVMRTDNKQRLDILFGIRGGWYIPIFKRKSEELNF